MLYRAFVDSDRGPGRVIVAALFGQQFRQVPVAHVERAGQGFVGVGIAADRLDAGGRDAADDRYLSRRRAPGCGGTS